LTAPASHTTQHDWKLFVIPLLIVSLLLGGGLAVRHTLFSSPRSTAVNLASTTAAPDFSIHSVNGPQFSLAAQRGHPVVMFFMAAWCISCLLESNALGRIERRHGNGVRIALVDIGRGDSPGALKDFVQRSQGPSRYWLLDAEGKIASAYGVQSLDTTYVIDKRGHVAFSDKFPLGYTDLNRVVGQVT
jgi:peroxiredoxin